MTDPIKQFEQDRAERIADYESDDAFANLSRQWLEASMRRRYVYNFNWLGRPIIQNPIDMAAMQEIIWETRPDLIVETGVAHGGSLVFSASMLALLDVCGLGKGHVVGIDIEVRPHNRKAIEAHPLSPWITLIEGSSVDPAVVGRVTRLSKGKKSVLVCLDSNHTHAHVLAELNAYGPLVSLGSYCVVFDTFVEDMPAGFFEDRPWDRGNNPKTAVHQWLSENSGFEIDRRIQNKLMISVAPDGFLKRVA